MSKRLRIPKKNHEEFFHSQGFINIVGIDEVGRGAWAGPLVAAAVKLPASQRLYRIRDSKLLTSREREKLAQKIKNSRAIFSIGIVKVAEINRIGLGQALNTAYKRALTGLAIRPDFVLVDGARIKNLGLPQKAIVKGDLFCASIAAASIIAKVARDRLMRQLAKTYRGYGFEKNKGYGTKWHRNALAKYGACKIHREYRPIKKIKNQNFK